MCVRGEYTEAARSLGRTPAGHPEGYLEAFANVYRAAARKIRGQAGLEDGCPTVDEGVRGLAFLETVIASAEEHSWKELVG